MTVDLNGLIRDFLRANRAGPVAGGAIGPVATSRPIGQLARTADALLFGRVARMRGLPEDGLERRVETRTYSSWAPGLTYHVLVDPPPRTRYEPIDSGDYVEVPDERPWSSRAWESFGDGMADLAYGFWITLGFPLALGAFWIALSYLIMVGGWALGANDLHPFPHFILMPGDSCAPYGDHCAG